MPSLNSKPSVFSITMHIASLAGWLAGSCADDGNSYFASSYLHFVAIWFHILFIVGLSTKCQALKLIFPFDLVARTKLCRMLYHSLYVFGTCFV